MAQQTLINPPQKPKTVVLTDATGVNAITTDGLGNLNVNLAAGSISGGNAAAAPTGVPPPVSADYTGFKDVSGNLVGVSAATPLPVSATVTPAPDPAEAAVGAAVPTDAIQIGGSDGTLLRAVATDAAGQVKVLVENAPAVAVNNFPATQPVSGSVSVSNLPATQPVSGTVAVSNLPATQPVSGTVAATIANGADVAEGTTTDPAWVSGAGTVISLLKKIASAGGSAVSIADGADTAEGTTTDAAVVSDVAGTVSAKLRGLVKIFADVWDSVNHRLKVDGSGVTQPVSGTFFQATQPVSGAVGINNFPATQPVSAAALPLPSGAATDASVTNTQVAAGATVAPTKVLVVAGKTSDVTPQYQPVPLTAAGAAVKVDGSAATQPVSGTVGVNNFPATQPVSAASLPLPTGAATAAKQPALGTAGTPSADVLSVQGVASMTALKVDGSAVTQPVSGTVAVNNFPATQPVSGTVSTKTDLTPSAPTAASVGVASAQVLAANANRKGLHLTNTSSNTISIGFGSAAVLNSGVTLTPFGVFWMDEFCFDNGAVFAIASVAASNLAIQEYST